MVDVLTLGTQGFRAVLVGAALAVVAIGAAATASGDSAPTAPLPFLTCGTGSYENSNGDCVPDPTRAPQASLLPPCAYGGTNLQSGHRSGECLVHGGVAQWFTP